MADNEISGTENANGVPQLKPCPFCGGEAEFHIYGRACNVVCDDCQIGTRLEHIDEYEVAVDAWNTRAERTCRITATATDGLMTDDPKKRFWLSCGHDVGMYGLDIKPRYCPTCGARVMNECIAEIHDCGDGITGLYCSECGNYIDENDRYCPQCGARVVEETPISGGTCRITATATDGHTTEDLKKLFWQERRW